MIVSRRQQRDSVPEPNIFGALTRGREKNLGRRRMRVFLEEVMLDFPHMIDAELVREFDRSSASLNSFSSEPSFPGRGS